MVGAKPSDRTADAPGTRSDQSCLRCSRAVDVRALRPSASGALDRAVVRRSGRQQRIDRRCGAARLRLGADRWAVRDAAARGRAALCGASWVAQAGDLARGASALFALGLGMGVPLLAFGTFGAGLLPKSGPWLVRIKHVFGLGFIAMAVWMLSRVTPEWLTFELCRARLIGLGLHLGATSVLSKKFWCNCRVG